MAHSFRNRKPSFKRPTDQRRTRPANSARRAVNAALSTAADFEDLDLAVVV